MKKILKSTNKMCLYCGKEIVAKWEEHEVYYECDCKDAKKKKEVINKIGELKKEIPKHKFVINSERVLRNLKL